MDSQIRCSTEWTIVDLDDLETLPLEFDPVLCFTEGCHLQVLQLIKYGLHRESWEWETQGLKRNQSFPLDFVKQWKNIEEPKA